MYRRLLSPRFNNSFFLLGPRGTGKSTLVQSWIDDKRISPESVLSFDLLDPELEKQFLREPNSLKQILLAAKPKLKWCVIDEIQKCPDLLNIVHHLIEKEKITFILTGSSARKLKRGNANLLAGRAFEYALQPLTASEIGKEFDLTTALSYGTLPKVLALTDPRDKKKFLSSYVNTYLKEEIIVEQLVRKIDRFRNFLPVAAQANGQVLNFSKIEKQSGVEEKSVARFFEILADTLVGFYLESYSRSVRKQQLIKPKFYFFDTGVTRAMGDLLDLEVMPQTTGYGKLFEQFVILEIKNRFDYSEKSVRLSYFSVTQGVEIDLVIEKPGKLPLLIEIKSASKITDEHTKSLRQVKADFPKSRRMIFYTGERNLVLEDGIEVFPWLKGITELLGS